MQEIVQSSCPTREDLDRILYHLKKDENDKLHTCKCNAHPLFHSTHSQFNKDEDNPQQSIHQQIPGNFHQPTDEQHHHHYEPEPKTSEDQYHQQHHERDCLSTSHATHITVHPHHQPSSLQQSQALGHDHTMAHQTQYISHDTFISADQSDHHHQQQQSYAPHHGNFVQTSHSSHHQPNESLLHQTTTTTTTTASAPTTDSSNKDNNSLVLMPHSSSSESQQCDNPCSAVVSQNLHPGDGGSCPISHDGGSCPVVDGGVSHHHHHHHHQAGVVVVASSSSSSSHESSLVTAQHHNAVPSPCQFETHTSSVIVHQADTSNSEAVHSYSLAEAYAAHHHHHYQSLSQVIAVIMS